MWMFNLVFGFVGFGLAFVVLYLSLISGWLHAWIPAVPVLPDKHLQLGLGVSCWLGSYLLCAVNAVVWYLLSAKSASAAARYESRAASDYVQGVRMMEYRQTSAPRQRGATLRLAASLRSATHLMPFILLTVLPICLMATGYVLRERPWGMFLHSHGTALVLCSLGIISICYLIARGGSGDITLAVLAAIGLTCTVVLTVCPHFSVLRLLTKWVLTSESCACGVLGSSGQ